MAPTKVPRKRSRTPTVVGIVLYSLLRSVSRVKAFFRLAFLAFQPIHTVAADSGKVMASMSRSLPFIVLLFAVFFSSNAHAQVRETAQRPLVLSVYGTASGSEHELDYGHALGGGGGFILEHSRLLALDFRGTILRYRVPLHTYIGEAGPRISRRYGRLEPYAEALGGLGHSGYRLADLRLASDYGAVWSLDAGLDFRVTPHFDWRVGEYSYNHTYVGAHGAKAAIGSVGVVYHF